jgi:hypothetical protein
MAAKGIFISSASADARIVRNVISRLRDLGLDPPAGVDLPRIWHYEEGMHAGDQIFANVDAAIDASALAVLCLSDTALARPWIVAEVTLLKKAVRERRLRQDHVIPVKVGSVTDASLADVRQFVSSPDQFVADLTRGEETELEKLAAQIHAKLEINAPKVLAIAVLAMTREQSGELLEDWQKLTAAGKATPVSKVCEAVGLRPPELFNLIRSRYGERPEDMMPFRGEALMQLVHAELNEANRRRVLSSYVPLFPRWLHGELLGDDVALLQRAQKIWTDNDSLLIIDSISTYHKQFMKQLGRVPDFTDRGAVVCLPPYTRQTVALEDAFGDAFAQNLDAQRLSSWFTLWRQRPQNPERMFAFDTTTSVSLGSWLERRFVIVPGKYLPQGNAVVSMPKSTFDGTPTQ